MPEAADRDSVSSLPSAPPHRAGCDLPVARSRRTRWRALVLIVVHLLVLAHVVHWKLMGSTFSPVEPSEAAETLTHGIVNAGFVLIVLLVLSTLILGRFFCGWACHVVAYQDLCAALLARIGIRPKPVRSRLLVFIPLFATAWVFLRPSLLRLWERGELPAVSWGATTDSLWETFPGPVIAILTILVDGFLLVWLFGAKGFCTYGCPYGALFGISDRFARGRIRVTDACEGCGHCTATCTSNVQVHREVALHRMVVDPGCMKCLDCVSVCPKDALHFGFGPTPDGPPRPAGKPRRSYDFTWPEEIAMAVIFLLAFLSFVRLYGAVPSMLAFGLAAASSIAAILVWRLISRQGFTFQHHVLKRSGRLTAAGFAAIALLPAYLLFTAHSALIQVDAHLGDRALRRASSLPRGSFERGEAVSRSLAHLGRIERWGLVPSAELYNKLGQLCIEDADHVRAERFLRLAIDLDDSLLSARTRLAEILIVDHRHAEATDVLEEILRRDPRNDVAGRRLGMIVQLSPDLEQARLLLVDLLIELGNLEGAENGLSPILDRNPSHPAALERLERIRASGR